MKDWEMSSPFNLSEQNAIKILKAIGFTEVKGSDSKHRHIDFQGYDRYGDFSVIESKNLDMIFSDMQAEAFLDYMGRSRRGYLIINEKEGSTYLLFRLVRVHRHQKTIDVDSDVF
mgnify:FL=1